jgi:hypothetical protein
MPSSVRSRDSAGSGCGHWTQQERPDEVNSEIIRFCASLTRSEGNGTKAIYLTSADLDRAARVAACLEVDLVKPNARPAHMPPVAQRRPLRRLANISTGRFPLGEGLNISVAHSVSHRQRK